MARGAKSRSRLKRRRRRSTRCCCYACDARDTATTARQTPPPPKATPPPPPYEPPPKATPPPPPYEPPSTAVLSPETVSALWKTFAHGLSNSNTWKDVAANMEHMQALERETHMNNAHNAFPVPIQHTIEATFFDIMTFVVWWLESEFAAMNMLDSAAVQTYDMHVTQANSWFPRYNLHLPFAAPIHTFMVSQNDMIMTAAKHVMDAMDINKAFDEAYALVAAASRRLQTVYSAIHDRHSPLRPVHQQLLMDKMTTIAAKGKEVLNAKLGTAFTRDLFDRVRALFPSLAGGDRRRNNAR